MTRKAKALMIQGTGSGVGKSIVTAGLCRVFSDMGLRVAPFKAQNMSLNSFVTEGSEEISRAQAVQARAARLEPDLDFNPVLLKPSLDAACQVIVHGRPVGTMTAKEYHGEFKRVAKEAIELSLSRLEKAYELIVIEGAGSPAEVNLKEMDIVNMAVAKRAKAPVLLIGDIDKGGVLASIVGTLSLLEEDEKELVRGLIINKFRGDIDLLSPALDFLNKRTNRPVLGVLPFVHDIGIEEEDSLPQAKTSERVLEIDVAVIDLPRMSNFTDFDPFAIEKGVSLRYVSKLSKLLTPDVVILPGSKNVLGDLDWLRKAGFEQAILKLKEAGTVIVGICGGFQMLGSEISDRSGLDAAPGWAKGLGLLDVSTNFYGEKITQRVTATLKGGNDLFADLGDHTFKAYEIHFGRTDFFKEKSIFKIDSPSGERFDGVLSADSLVFGTYLHGLFEDDLVRSAFLNGLKKRKGLATEDLAFNFNASCEDSMNRWADALRENLDIEKIISIAMEGV